MGVSIRGRVRWIQKDDRTALIRAGFGKPAQCARDAPGLDLEAGADLEHSQIFPNCGHGRRSVVHEVNQACPAAQSLDAHRSGAGVKVGEDGALDACGQDIKECLAQAIAGGPGGQPAGRDQPPRTVSAPNDTHISPPASDLMVNESHASPTGGRLYNAGSSKPARRTSAMRGWSF